MVFRIRAASQKERPEPHYSRANVAFPPFGCSRPHRINILQVIQDSMPGLSFAVAPPAPGSHELLLTIGS
jgi:hypothetical protein